LGVFSGDGDQAALVTYAHPSSHSGSNNLAMRNRQNTYAPWMDAMKIGAIITEVYW